MHTNKLRQTLAEWMANNPKTDDIIIITQTQTLVQGVFIELTNIHNKAKARTTIMQALEKTIADILAKIANNQN